MASFDLSQLKELLGNDEEALKDILRAFATDYERYISELEISVTSKNSENIRKSAHALKSVVGTFNLTDLFEYVNKIENKAKENSLENIPELFDKFKSGILDFRSWIKKTYLI